jgi:hypothetical protein
MELAPRLLPALCDRVRVDVREVLAHDLLAVVVGVDRVAVAEVLDAAREELQQLGELDLAARDDNASQRNALLSLSKNPSSAL